MLYNSLFSFRVNLSKENTKHYLFEELEEGVKAEGKAKEFTEDDLKMEEPSKEDGFDFKVKSTPRKASIKD